jgi:acyl carrier protein
MNRADFTREFAEILNIEADKLLPETELGNLEDWDSVAYLSAVVLVDEKLAIKIRPEVISRAKTFADILSALGPAFEE